MLGMGIPSSGAIALAAALTASPVAVVQDFGLTRVANGLVRPVFLTASPGDIAGRAA
jgi:hypothetical protein